MVAKKRPFGMAPRQWPARPTRCMATATARVVLIWQTRSMSPMSMPSSSEAVAIRILISPFLRRCSASRRRVREREPWWAATFSGPMSGGEFEGDLLDQAAGVDEDKGGAMVLRVDS